MAWFKSISDRIDQKRRQLEREATEKAARLAFEQGARAAKEAIGDAAKAVASSLFGRDEPLAPTPEPPARTTRETATAPSDERAREAARQARARAAAAEDQEIDAELAALKKKLGR